MRKACAERGIWPLSRLVEVNDTETGVAEGRAAGKVLPNWRVCSAAQGCVQRTQLMLRVPENLAAILGSQMQAPE
jgi:hypothetical protein